MRTERELALVSHIAFLYDERTFCNGTEAVLSGGTAASIASDTGLLRGEDPTVMEGVDAFSIRRSS